MSTIRTARSDRRPAYLREAVIQIFGEQCRNCGVDRPIEVAHIDNWLTCREAVSEGPVTGRAAEIVRELALDRFQDLGNMLPLCANCHRIYDSCRWSDITRRDVVQARDRALTEAGVVRRTINFLEAEVGGRPNRIRVGVTEQKIRPGAFPAFFLTPGQWLKQARDGGVVELDAELFLAGPDGWNLRLLLDGPAAVFRSTEPGDSTAGDLN